ncbi:MAG: UDP-N-acetylmuramoyl-L-alanyl-D-glutamate--2,6-diaminopimelate ligase [Gammaproteobacteria bacterium]|nr:MAG: UDP-N-acetylmuramoyl-L-alanyl-D-glutamate--2,6-diaminopimelate ligase [Gammaproteobacteria bacterium]
MACAFAGEGGAMMPALIAGNEWRLRDLLDGTGVSAEVPDLLVNGISQDTRQLQPGAVFFALPGQRGHGARFLQAAAQAGAAAIVADEKEGLSTGTKVPVVPVSDVASALGIAADRFYQSPTRSLRLVGITGTNGKTTVAQWVAAALHGWPQDDQPCGLLGTLGYGVFGELQPGGLTTPDTITAHQYLSAARDRGARFAVMEVSSHGLEQQRVAGLRFDTAVFTNLGRDHLDYHGDMQRYGRAKRRLFAMPELKNAAINLEDEQGRKIIQRLGGRVNSVGFSLDNNPGVLGRKGKSVIGTLQTVADGLDVSVSSSWGKGHIHLPGVLGRFNALNALGALATLLVLDMPIEIACKRRSERRAPDGRMQMVSDPGQGTAMVVVDYAHTPDALAEALGALRPYCTGELWCVFGCGGERDRGKRPLMGEVAARLADRLVITDDNPRGEDGDQIVADILAGVSDAGKRLQVCRDRGEAIREAIRGADSVDIVLIAGKGHENYQDAGNRRYPFSDIAAARGALGGSSS